MSAVLAGGEGGDDVPLADLWQRIEDMPGPLFAEREDAYEECWRRAGKKSAMPFLLLELEWDLGIPIDGLRRLRCDFLSAESGKADSDGFWLLMLRAVGKSMTIGEKYQSFWNEVFPSSLYRGHTTVANSNASRLDFAFSVACLRDLAEKLE